MRNEGGVRLARALVAAGYRHCTTPSAACSPNGQWFFEVYPHPAHVVLFGRDRIIKYKKGSVAKRRAGLAEFWGEILNRIFAFKPSLMPGQQVHELLAEDLHALRGTQLKQYEDSLDAILCSYLAFHLWRWGWGRSEMIGDLQHGYIVVPTVALPSEPSS